MGKPAQDTRPLTFTERQTFCQTGGLPLDLTRRFLPLGPQNAEKILTEIRVKMYFSDLYCGCGEEDPVWLGPLKARLNLFNRNTYFPNLRQRNFRKYSDAVDALNDYRRNHKPFHDLWAAVEYAAREASLGLDETGTRLVVNISEHGWNEFLRKMINLVPGKLQSEIEAKLKEAVQSGMRMSERSRLRMSVVSAYLDRIGMLQMIYEGVRARELANLDKHHEEAIEYKVRHFLGIIANNPSHYGELRRKYADYEEAYWRLQNYRSLEARLRERADTSRPSTASMRATSSQEVSMVRLPADAGLP